MCIRIGVLDMRREFFSSLCKKKPPSRLRAQEVNC